MFVGAFRLALVYPPSCTGFPLSLRCSISCHLTFPLPSSLSFLRVNVTFVQVLRSPITNLHHRGASHFMPSTVELVGIVRGQAHSLSRHSFLVPQFSGSTVSRAVGSKPIVVQVPQSLTSSDSRVLVWVSCYPRVSSGCYLPSYCITRFR